MKEYFSLLFWGLLLVIFDISINGFDILLDGVGYLIIAAGRNGLATLSPRFAVARILCFALAILWLVDLVIEGEIAIVYGLITTFVNCLFIWQLLGGIAELALSRDRLDLAAKAHYRRLVYVIILIGTAFLTLVTNGSNAGPIAVLLLVSMFVLMAMILHLIHRTKVELGT